MARYEGDIRLHQEKPLTLDELLMLLGKAAAGEERSREDAIACYLSASDGWRDAMKRLQGTFADRPATLTERQED